VFVKSAMSIQVQHSPPTEEKGIGYQPAVASPPLSLGAHHRDALNPRLVFKRRQPFPELIGPHVVGVALELANAPTSVSRVLNRVSAPPEALQVQVADPAGCESRIQLFGLSPGHSTGARKSAHVDQRLDILLVEEVHEAAGLMVGMADS
jgi:hypothetical protein